MRMKRSFLLGLSSTLLISGCGFNHQLRPNVKHHSSIGQSNVSDAATTSYSDNAHEKRADIFLSDRKHDRNSLQPSISSHGLEEMDSPASQGNVCLASAVTQNGSEEIILDTASPGTSLEDLLSFAFANNPAIKELAATTQIAAGYRTQVGLYANPTLGYQGQQLADAGTDQHIVFVQQQFITGGKLQLNRAVLNEAVRAQLQELEAQKLRVATDIKTVYYDSIRIQQQLSAIEQFAGLLQQGVNAAEQRMQAGEGSKIDLLQTQVQLKQLELDRRQLKVSLDARLREIVAIVGMPDMQLEGVSGELPETPITQDWKALESLIVGSSPEYAAAQARIRQASAAVRRQESQPLPNLGVQFGAGVDNSTNSGMMNVQVGAPIPVFNKNQGNIAAARAEYCRALQEAQRIDNAIRARLAIASGEYCRADEAVKMYASELLPAAQETLNLAEEAYKAGEQDFIQLLVTRRTYFDTNLAFIAARAQLASAQAQIDGYLLTGALNAVINNSGDDSLRGLTLGQE
jgi:cobalt-zinc-cadmium efflux system outer membrane protein